MVGKLTGRGRPAGPGPSASLMASGRYTRQAGPRVTRAGGWHLIRGSGRAPMPRVSEASGDRYARSGGCGLRQVDDLDADQRRSASQQVRTAHPPAACGLYLDRVRATPSRAVSASRLPACARRMPGWRVAPASSGRAVEDDDPTGGRLDEAPGHGWYARIWRSRFDAAVLPDPAGRPRDAAAASSSRLPRAAAAAAISPASHGPVVSASSSAATPRQRRSRAAARSRCRLERDSACATIGPVSSPASMSISDTPVSMSPARIAARNRGRAAVARQQRRMQVQRSVAGHCRASQAARSGRSRPAPADRGRARPTPRSTSGSRSRSVGASAALGRGCPFGNGRVGRPSA